MSKELYNKILPQMQAFYELTHKGKKAGKKPKLSVPQIATLYIILDIIHSPVLSLAKSPISPTIKSYHIFRKEKQGKSMTS